VPADGPALAVIALTESDELGDVHARTTDHPPRALWVVADRLICKLAMGER